VGHHAPTLLVSGDLTSVHPIGVHFMGVHFTGGYLMGVHFSWQCVQQQRDDARRT
jgi:hypothetical protein